MSPLMMRLLRTKVLPLSHIQAVKTIINLLWPAGASKTAPPATSCMLPGASTGNDWGRVQKTLYKAGCAVLRQLTNEQCGIRIGFLNNQTRGGVTIHGTKLADIDGGSLTIMAMRGGLTAAAVASFPNDAYVRLFTKDSEKKSRADFDAPKFYMHRGGLGIIAWLMMTTPRVGAEETAAERLVMRSRLFFRIEYFINGLAKAGVGLGTQDRPVAPTAQQFFDALEGSALNSHNWTNIWTTLFGPTDSTVAWAIRAGKITSKSDYGFDRQNNDRTFDVDNLCFGFLKNITTAPEKNNGEPRITANLIRHFFINHTAADGWYVHP